MMQRDRIECPYCAKIGHANWRMGYVRQINHICTQQELIQNDLKKINAIMRNSPLNKIKGVV